MVKYINLNMLEKYKKIHWTEHCKMKMRQYGLSKMKLMSLLRKPDRKEEGIATGTTALMSRCARSGVARQTNNSKFKYQKPAGEIWLMYQDNKDFRKIVSAWRYPGISKPGESIPIPEDIKRELLNKSIV